MKPFFLSLVLWVGAGLAACAADPLAVADLNFTLAPEWKSVEPSSAMRKATLQITAPGATAPLEANFFHFGGDVDSNLARWKGQVEGAEPAVEKKEVEGRTVVHYHAVGTYNDPFGGKGPQADYALLGAMITVPDQGPVVIKLAGPKAEVEAVKAAFKALVESALKK
jgi:hypothetical protein